MSEEDQVQTTTAQVQPEHIEETDLLRVQLVQSNLKLVKTELEKAELEVKLAQQSFDNFVGGLYQKYNLKQGDSIEQSGRIIRK